MVLVDKSFLLYVRENITKDLGDKLRMEYFNTMILLLTSSLPKIPKCEEYLAINSSNIKDRMY